jgi:hypothetical protein
MAVSHERLLIESENVFSSCFAQTTVAESAACGVKTADQSTALPGTRQNSRQLPSKPRSNGMWSSGGGKQGRPTRARARS